jgi:hypothetical protein
MERPASEQELVALHAPFISQIHLTRPQPANTTSAKRMTRPPSYSDSFFFMPLNHTNDIRLLTDEIASSSPPPLSQLSPLDPARDAFDVSGTPLSFSPIRRYSTCAVWTIRSLSFGFHIMLIGIFETLFFFLFISKSEDAGIQGTIQNYIEGVLSQCSHWSTNETQLVNAILSVFIQANQTLASAQSAMRERDQYNGKLEVQAWMYVVGITACLLTGGAVARLNSIRIPWKRILLENMIMVALLGIYEFTFFKTIIYNYRSLTFEELNGNIVHQLQTTCNVLK